MLTLKTIPENFFTTAEKFSKRRALSYKKDRAYFSLSYAETAAEVRKAATVLAEAGVTAGDKVAILSPNRPEWAIIDLAIMSLGAVVVPIHTTLSPKIIGYVLRHSGAKVLVVADINLLNRVALAKDDLEFLEKIFFLGDLDDDIKELAPKEIFSFNQLLSDAKEIEHLAKHAPDEVCSIIYTSGTTGVPKGVELTHVNFLSNVISVTRAVPAYPQDVFLSFMPLSHVLERTAGYYVPLLSGSNIVYAESVKELPKNLREAKPTILICAPRIFEKFYSKIWDNVSAGSRLKRKMFHFALKQKRRTIGYFLADKLVFKKIRKNLGGRLRLTVSGGASLDYKIAKFFLKIGVLVLEGYGLTETSPIVSVNLENNFKFSTVGKPLEGVEVKIAADHEILVRGRNVMQGYYKNSEATKEAIDDGGWFHTGDLGFLDQDNFLSIIGRKKEMIVTAGGKNIWPEVIEQRLNFDHLVSQSMIVGHKRKFVSALVVPDWYEINLFLKEKNLPQQEPAKMIKDPAIVALFEERVAKVNLDLPDYEQVRSFRLLVNEFSQEKDEMTATMKLRRHVIERNYQREVEEMYR